MDLGSCDDFCAYQFVSLTQRQVALNSEWTMKTVKDLKPAPRCPFSLYFLGSLTTVFCSATQPKTPLVPVFITKIAKGDLPGQFGNTARQGTDVKAINKHLTTCSSLSHTHAFPDIS